MKTMKTTKTMKVSEMIKQLETIKETHGDTELKFIDVKGNQLSLSMNTLTINGITAIEIKRE